MSDNESRDSRLSKPIKMLGIEFAPMSLPMERRLQTLAVTTWMGLFLYLGPAVTVLMICLLYTDYNWVTFLYLGWMAYDWNTPVRGGRNFNFVRRWKLWKYFSDYFPIKLVKTAELDPNTSYLFGSHPHGLLCAGAFCCFATEAMNFSKIFPGLQSRLLTIRGFSYLPAFRELFLCTGTCAATKVGMEHLLKEPKGHVTVLVVGGGIEACNSDTDCVRLYINKRKGFVKLALRFGVDLVPTFSFGEYSIYKQVGNQEGSWFKKFQVWAQKYVGFPPIIFFGRGIFQYNFGIVPFRKPITVVVGKPIHVDKNPSPTRDDVESLHAKYVDALKDLFNEYNPIYGEPDVPLIIE